MTCVWDALIAKIPREDMRTALGITQPTAHTLVSSLKSKNCATVGVRWQGNALTQKQMEENMKWIETHDITTIRNGYDCSSCDAYIILVCYLFKVKIHHQYLTTQIVYDPPGPPKYTLSFANNSGHFW
jgi:hypothetical protein